MTHLRFILLGAVLLLAACETPEPEFGQCSPGVADLSRIETALPTC